MSSFSSEKFSSRLSFLKSVFFFFPFILLAYFGIHFMNILISVFAPCMSNSSLRILITLYFYSIFWSLPSTALILFPTVLNRDYNNPNIIVYSSISILLSFFLVHLSSLMKISAYYLIFYKIQVLFNFWKIQMILINTYFFLVYILQSIYFTNCVHFSLLWRIFFFFWMAINPPRSDIASLHAWIVLGALCSLTKCLSNCHVKM